MVCSFHPVLPVGRWPIGLIFFFWWCKLQTSDLISGWCCDFVNFIPPVIPCGDQFELGPPTRKICLEEKGMNETLVFFCAKIMFQTTFTFSSFNLECFWHCQVVGIWKLKPQKTAIFWLILWSTITWRIFSARWNWQCKLVKYYQLPMLPSKPECFPRSWSLLSKWGSRASASTLLLEIYRRISPIMGCYARRPPLPTLEGVWPSKDFMILKG